MSCSAEPPRFGGGWGGSVGRLAASTGDVAVFFDIWSHSKPEHRRCSWFFFLPRWRTFASSAMAYYDASSLTGFVPDVGVDGRGVELFFAAGGQGFDRVF